ncbi:MAG: hypothetical protein U9R79_10765 [Armatimonadota bacterium]|nr:hypothetical protein [Armatimonadota bacterium]
MSRAALMLLILPLAATQAAGEPTFPLNGGFEMIADATPVGWLATGLWRTVRHNTWQGERSLHVFPTDSHPDMELRSAGYLPVSAGLTVALEFAYHASGEGAWVGLEPCDAIGRAVGPVEQAALEPHDAWRKARWEYELAAADIPPGTSSLRVVAGLSKERVALGLDEVTLTAPGQGAPQWVSPPTREPLSMANLLPAAVRCGSAWRRISVSSETDDERVWVTPPVRVDVSSPHRISAIVPPAQAVHLLYRFLEPGGTTVLFQGELERAGGESCPGAEALTPRLSLLPRAADLQLLTIAGPGVVAPIPTDLAARPRPMTLQLSGVGGRTSFEDPGGVSVFVSLENSTRQALDAAAQITVCDAQGKTVHSEARSVSIGPRSFSSLPVRPKLQVAGDYRLIVTLVADGRIMAEGAMDLRVAQARRKVPAWRTKPFTLQVRGAGAQTVFPEARQVSIFISAINNTERELQSTARMRVVTADEHEVDSEDRAIRIAPRSTAHFPFRPDLPGDGDYRFEISMTEGDTVLGEEQLTFTVGEPRAAGEEAAPEADATQ